MWKNFKGFTLVEVLGALVIWMVIASVLLPGLIRMNQERKGFFLEQQARFILTLELENIRTGTGLFEGGTINKNGTEYSLSMVEDNGSAILCVSFKDYRLLEKERCVYVHHPK